MREILKIASAKDEVVQYDKMGSVYFELLSGMRLEVQGNTWILAGFLRIGVFELTSELPFYVNNVSKLSIFRILLLKNIEE